MLDQLTVETFEPHVGTTFWVEFPNETRVELRLASAAKAMESEAAKLPRHPFSLLFVGPKSFHLQQRMYPLTHDALGTLEMFLVPVGEQNELFLYEAAFA